MLIWSADKQILMTLNLNDPYCQQFIDAVASILVHLAQQGPALKEEREELSPAQMVYPCVPDRAPCLGAIPADRARQ